MNDLIIDQERLREWTGRLLLPIQAERQIDLLAAREVVLCAKKLARTLKGCELIPRSILNELHRTIRILRAEIPYLKNGVGDASQVADEIELVFDMILRGECFGDRVPGVPRII
ncbi:hypothetical protein J3P95_10810 [Pseudomonas sp. Z5-35]|uniref:hypothetical protein n=1 Tax=unclassified Pseudomonas TaxID=196821 RepID=UPI003DA9ED71